MERVETIRFNRPVHHAFWTRVIIQNKLPMLPVPYFDKYLQCFKKLFFFVYSSLCFRNEDRMVSLILKHMTKLNHIQFSRHHRDTLSEIKDPLNASNP